MYKKIKAFFKRKPKLLFNPGDKVFVVDNKDWQFMILKEGEITDFKHGVYHILVHTNTYFHKISLKESEVEIRGFIECHYECEIKSMSENKIEETIKNFYENWHCK